MTGNGWDAGLDPWAGWPVLGARVDALTLTEWQGLVAAAIAARRRLVVASQNLHGVYLYHREHAMRELHQRAHVRIDGMSLVYWARLLGYPARRSHRVTWVDWMPLLMEGAAREGWRIFYLGSRPGVAEQGASVLARQHPGLFMATHHGYFDIQIDGNENLAVVARVNRARPDVLLVGMGMPRQEEWVLGNQGRLEVPVILTCGAAIQYVAGDVRTPPRWLGTIGLEWLFRLLGDPRRLAWRYLLEPWTLLPLMARDLWRHRVAKS